MRVLVLIILVIALAAPTRTPIAASDYGLFWGIEPNQILAYRLLETITNQTQGMKVVEDVHLYLITNSVPDIPSSITTFSEVPILWGTMLDQDMTIFTPFLSKLEIYPPIFPPSSKQRMAMPAGNWTMMTQLLIEEGFYRQSENATHWSNSISVVAMNRNEFIITPATFNDSIPTTLIPGNIYIKNNWTYMKSNGTLAGAIGSWETDSLLLEYRMIRVKPADNTSTVTSDDMPTSSFPTTDQLQTPREIVVVLAASCGIGLVLVVYLCQRRDQMNLIVHSQQ